MSTRMLTILVKARTSPVGGRMPFCGRPRSRPAENVNIGVDTVGRDGYPDEYEGVSVHHRPINGAAGAEVTPCQGLIYR
jgi:hypothetical protein